MKQTHHTPLPFVIIGPFNNWILYILFLVYLYINLASLFVCLSVFLYPIHVKTAEPMGPKFFVGHLGTPGKVYESSKKSKIA